MKRQTVKKSHNQASHDSSNMALGKSGDLPKNTLAFLGNDLSVKEISQKTLPKDSQSQKAFLDQPDQGTPLPAYWESMDSSDLSKANKEFASTPLISQENAIERRDFLKLMGASLALTSMSCIRRPVEKIVPYANRPEEIEPGIANYYCSTYTSGGEGQSIIVKTREGRPIYVKSNPNFSGGSNHGLSLSAQAHILDLYSPDRLQEPYQGGRDKKPSAFQKITWKTLDENVKKALKEGSVGLLTSSISSPSTNTLIQSFLKPLDGKHYSWDPIGADDVMEGQEACFGQSLVPSFRFDKAKLIVSIAADFLSTWLAPSYFSTQFATGRKPGKDMSKLIVFEALHSLTGANADVRFRVPPSQFLNVVMALIYEIVVKNKHSRFAQNQEVLSTLSQSSQATQETGIDPAVISQLAKDLWDQRGQSLIVTGGLQARTYQGKALQVATNFLNTVLENDGKTIDTNFAMTSFKGSYAQLDALVNDLEKNRIKTLIISDIDPFYTMGRHREALLKAKTIIYLSDRFNDTSGIADFVAPLSHQMEVWGDAELFKGAYSIKQPTIRPLYNTRCLEENLLAWGSSDVVSSELLSYLPELYLPQSDKSPAKQWYRYLRDQWKVYQRQTSSERSKNFEVFWLELLHRGFVQSRPLMNFPNRSFKLSSLSLIRKTKRAENTLELSLYAKATIGDGKSAHNAWLQEIPDPVTKVVWDNYLLMSPSKAKELGLKNNQHVQVQSDIASITVPLLISPGVHDQTVGLAVGYGQWQRDSKGTAQKLVGKNAYSFMDKGVFASLRVSVEKAEGQTILANVQGHHRMAGRQLVVEATLKDYLKSPSVNIHRHKLFSLYPKHEYKGHRWAMAIDLNACTGCSACMLACQSENNVPTVGKKYILQGREMHWIRIDRYYTGSANDPDVVFQPMLCQHCENASCEAVCPVAATVHGEEGLNQMAYNRCVGTRYCSNNCPYKVRRFNWFNYTKVADSLKNAYNPDVTVRTRGVMEKCTFCTQRIKEAKVLAKREDRIFKGEDVVTACQEACPTQAIVFGDINDPDSKVSEAFRDERNFSVLEEYNNIPMVRYKTKIRNSNQLKGKDKGHHA